MNRTGRAAIPSSPMFAPSPPFEPHPLLPGGHAQTVAGAALRCRAPRLAAAPGFAAVAVPLRDGGQLEAWHRVGDTGLAVALFHGLGGSVDSGYLRATGDALARAGHTVLAVASRGSGGAAESTDRPYMTGHSADVADAVRWLRARHRGRVLAVGYSISGNTVLKLMAEGREPRPDFAIAVAPPLDLDRASMDLLRPSSRPYDLWILRSCRRWIPRLRGDHRGPTPVPRFSSLRTFDERYITPVWGFESLDHYYRSASAGPLLERIDRPTLILHAADDPVVSPRHVLAAPRSPSVRVDLQPGGGHLGYLERGRRRPGRWLPRAVAHHASHLAHA